MTAAAVIGLAKGVVFAKVLGPRDLGYYGLTLLVLQFGLLLSNWGILNALNNFLPVALGRGDRSVDELRRGGLGALLATAFLTSAAYLVVIVAIDPPDSNVKIALALAAGTTLLATLSEFFLVLLRVEHRLVELSSTYLLRSILAIGLGAAAGAGFGYVGAIVSEFCALLVSILLCWRTWLPGVIPHWPGVAGVRRLVRLGGPLLISNLTVAATFTIDRLFVAGALPDQFGQYTFATIAVVAWAAVAGMLNQAIAPPLLQEMGGGSSFAEVRARAIRITVAIAAIGVVGLGCLLVAAGLLRSEYLSEYKLGFEVLPVLYLGGLIATCAFPGFMLNVVRPSYVVAAAGLAAAVSVVGSTVATVTEAGLQAFAWVFTGSQVIATIMVLVGLWAEARRARTIGGGRVRSL